MPFWDAFTGGSYRDGSPIFAADQTINMMLSTREQQGSPKQKVLTGTPGLKSLTTVGTLRCRGWFMQDEITIVTVGNTIYTVDGSTATAVGTIVDDGFDVSYASNGQGGDQIGIVGGGQLRVLGRLTRVLTPVALPFVGPVRITFIDGYALINQLNSPKVWFSSLEDMTIWDALDFFARSGTSDNIVAITVTRDRVWAFGSETTTLYYDSGNLDTPFLPYPGTTVQRGLANPWAFVVYEDVVHWITQARNGQRSIVHGSDPSGTPISTVPLDLFLARCTTLDDAELDLYEQAGHPFCVVTCPSSPDEVQTYAFDLRESQWHARASVDPIRGNYLRWRVRGLCVKGQTVLAGDAVTGDLYALDLDTFTENGAVLKRERTAPYLGADNQWGFLDQFELGSEAGMGLSTGQGSDPTVELQISRDGAETWISAGVATLGKIGGYLARTIWRRLGRSRMDRLVLRVIQTDPVRAVWTGAWVTVTPGTGQL